MFWSCKAYGTNFWACSLARGLFVHSLSWGEFILTWWRWHERTKPFLGNGATKVDMRSWPWFLLVGLIQHITHAHHPRIRLGWGGRCATALRPWARLPLSWADTGSGVKWGRWGLDRAREAGDFIFVLDPGVPHLPGRSPPAGILHDRHSRGACSHSGPRSCPMS